MKIGLAPPRPASSLGFVWSQSESGESDSLDGYLFDDSVISRVDNGPPLTYAERQLPIYQPNQPPLEFLWNEISDAEFTHRARVYEQQLSDPQLTVVKQYRLPKTTNATFVVELSNGLVGLWKTVEGETTRTMRQNVPIGGQTVREVAAYVIDKAADHYARVTPAVMRELGGKKGALILFLPGTRPFSETERQPTVDRNSPGYQRLNFWDNAYGHLDRHGGNLLLQPGHGGQIPIDHGLGLPVRNDHQGFHEFLFDQPASLTAREHSAVSSWLGQRLELTRELTGLGVEPEAVSSFFERVEEMQALGTTALSWRNR